MTHRLRLRASTVPLWIGKCAHLFRIRLRTLLPLLLGRPKRESTVRTRWAPHTSTYWSACDHVGQQVETWSVTNTMISCASAVRFTVFSHVRGRERNSVFRADLCELPDTFPNGRKSMNQHQRVSNTIVRIVGGKQSVCGDGPFMRSNEVKRGWLLRPLATVKNLKVTSVAVTGRVAREWVCMIQLGYWSVESCRYVGTVLYKRNRTVLSA